MKKKKLSELTKVSELGSSGRVVSLSSDMKTVMAATKNAINSNVSLSPISGFTGDNAFEIFESGISLASIVDGVSLYGFPISTGMLVNIQKNAKGNAMTNQRSYQIAININDLFFRAGSGDGEKIVYQAWKKITMVGI